MRPYNSIVKYNKTKRFSKASKYAAYENLCFVLKNRFMAILLNDSLIVYAADGSMVNGDSSEMVHAGAGASVVKPNFMIGNVHFTLPPYLPCPMIVTVPFLSPAVLFFPHVAL